MHVSEFLKEYLKWFLPLLVATVILYFTFKPASLIGLLVLIVPMERARVMLIRKNYEIPSINEAWLIIGISVFPPLIFSTLLGVYASLESGELSINTVMSFQFVFTLPVFIVSSIGFLSKTAWKKAQQKYSVSNITKQ
ncbi:hypothetical protein ACMZOO_00790 [Catenovulum sp. SX2]|uniref:hypothetical protein n=1 Tax=Catenovulum sp. SX2 TaxID=3398614 RepID=UPI003F879C4C